MKNFHFGQAVFWGLLFLFFGCFLSVAKASEDISDINLSKVTQQNKIDNLLLLETMHKHVTELERQLEQKRQALKTAQSSRDKEKILEDINELSLSLEDLQTDFVEVATGVDLDDIEKKSQEQFQWSQELVSLVKPLIQELKKLTARPRNLDRLRSESSFLRSRLPEVNNAVQNLSGLIREAEEPAVKERLRNLREEWENKRSRLENSLAVVESQLKKLERDKQSFIESARQNLEDFFRNRGKNALFAILAFIAVFLGFRFVHRLIRKLLQKSRKRKKNNFYGRLIELCLHIITFVAAIGALLAVLFAAGDWVLLSLVIIFLLGVGWTAKQGFMRFWEQIKLFLNLGSVREGERIVYSGVPWRVSNLNFYSSLENPAFKRCRIRIPIKDLVDSKSRPFAPEEPWFPCQEGDWLLFGDGSQAKVISQTHEMVQTIKRGGSRQTYQTSDFLSLAPLNLSTNFRIRVSFGIDYAHQSNCTEDIPETLKGFIQEGFEQYGDAGDILDLRVEFESAGASSLDLIMIADFHGRRAKHYNRLRRRMQRMAVDACNKYKWGIPFNQITIHQAHE
ncbi:MAG: hypothetical protein ACQES5_06035 [Thermodesulfobacteriota bacterium]